MYYLTKNCKFINDNSEYGTKWNLNLNLTGAFIKSHIDYLSDSGENEGYPDNFLCEIVAEASPGHVVMLIIESLYIPAQNSLCDENYLYVFDFRSSRSKAMTAAGGEKGLCNRMFPRFPIFTTGPYITIVFKTNLRDTLIPHDAGFQLTLTQVLPADKNNACKSGYYQCNPINYSSMPNQIDYKAALLKQEKSPKSNPMSPITLAHQIIPKRTITEIVNYCIPFGLICDSVRNCHDGSDEDVNARKLCSEVTGKSIVTRFLSLGLSASIAIAVSCTIAVTVCIGITVCYCMRMCTSRFPSRPNQSSKSIITGSDFQAANSFSSNLPINHFDTTFCSPFIANQSAQFGCIKDASPPSSSFESDKIFCLYQESQLHAYNNMPTSMRPLSDKICHWTSSSLTSYPSTSEGHHSYPEAPYYRETTFGEQHSPQHADNRYRTSNNRGSHHTPTSSRSAKSTRSTKSSNVDKKSIKNNGSNSQNQSHTERMRKYPVDYNRIMVLGPVLGEV